jgi:hypothetical protein
MNMIKKTALAALAAAVAAAVNPAAAFPIIKDPVIKGPVKPIPPIGPKPLPPKGPGGWGGKPWHPGIGLGLGVVGGMALGAMAASSAYAEECYVVRRKVVDEYGDVYIRRIRVCE